MARPDPYIATKRLEADINRLLSAFDVTELDRQLQRQVSDLKRGITDARLDVREYELAETRVEQQTHSREARERLDRVRQGMLLVSQANIFSAVEVAQLSATIDSIQEAIA